jgi:hypothetical protein
MGGKVILVRSAQGRLEPVTAISYDGVSQIVTLDRIVQLEDEPPTLEVPLVRCFEFDADMMEHVNALVGAATDKMNAAQQLCDTGLLQAEFITVGDPGSLQMH